MSLYQAWNERTNEEPRSSISLCRACLQPLRHVAYCELNRVSMACRVVGRTAVCLRYAFYEQVRARRRISFIKSERRSRSKDIATEHNKFEFDVWARCFWRALHDRLKSAVPARAMLGRHNSYAMVHRTRMPNFLCIRQN